MPSASASPFPNPEVSSLLHAWQKLVAAAPQAPALIEAADGRVYTRSELDASANAWVERYSGPNLRQRRIAFAHPNGVRWFAAFLGSLKAGAIAVPLDGSEPLDQQRRLACHAGAAFLEQNGCLERLDTPGAPDDESICLVKLTSGTTGTPRPLLFTHRQMAADAQQVSSTMGVLADDVNVALVPFGHSYGLGNLVVPLLLQGTPSLCVSAPLPHALAADFARWRPTVFPAVPALLRVLSISDISPTALASVRVLISAGAALTPEVAQAFHRKFGVQVHSFYGSTETGGITYDRHGDATLHGSSVGTPLEGVRLQFDADRRFWVESSAVYTHQNPHVSPDGTGRHMPADLGELNAMGELVLVGRTGRMVKIAGRRLDLTELEASLRQLPQIRDAFAITHPDRPDELAAVVATSLPLEEARQQVRAHLAPWKVPRRLLVVHEFPTTARGKIDTRALRELLGVKSS